MTDTKADLTQQAEDGVIRQAMMILEQRCKYEPIALSSPLAVREFLTLRLNDAEHEIFVCVWLDAQNRLLKVEELFRGTLTQTSVYPREVVKSALKHNAAGVIFAHNHPSGMAEPSRADELITQSLKQSLALVDVTTVDHMIVAGNRILSFAERGLL